MHALNEMPRQMHQDPKEVLKDGCIIHTVPPRENHGIQAFRKTLGKTMGQDVPIGTMVDDDDHQYIVIILPLIYYDRLGIIIIIAIWHSPSG